MNRRQAKKIVRNVLFGTGTSYSEGQMASACRRWWRDGKTQGRRYGRWNPLSPLLRRHNEAMELYETMYDAT